MSKLRVLLADDHRVVREGLSCLITDESDMEVVGEVSNGADALQQAVELRPDVVVMDVAMPVLNGVEATRRIKQAAPEIKVIALTVYEHQSYVRELLGAGADGYLLKRAAAHELIAALRAVRTGRVHIDPRVLANLLPNGLAEPGKGKAGGDGLTDRETAVLRLIALGYSNKEIAAELKLSVKTVETYKARGMDKAGLRSRVDIVRLGGERGWFAPC
jgi:DNA-binding NarL/FixJ family response regulator